MQRGQRPLVHRLRLPGVDPCDAVRREDLVEDRPLEVHRRPVGGRLGGEVGGLVPGRPLPLALLQEVEGRPEGVVVQGDLDREDLEVLGKQVAHAGGGGVQGARRRVHVGAAVHHRVHVVVVPEAPVGGKAHRHALVATVHGDEVDVDVDEQVALCGSP